MNPTMSVRIDREADAAYIELSKNKVVRTVEVTDAILLDLDEYNIVVGVEVLELSAEIPFTRLHTEFHVHSEVVELLRLVRPSVSGFISFTSGRDSDTVSTGSKALVLA